MLNRFENGERHISFRYWTRTATFEPMLAEDHMALYRDEETGDVIAVNYVLDRTEHYRLEEKKRALEKSNREYAKLLEEEKSDGCRKMDCRRLRHFRRNQRDILMSF